MKIVRVFTWFVLFMVLFSCEEKKEKLPTQNQLSKAKGGFSDVVLVVDKKHWSDELKKVFEETLAEEVKGLYSPESEFDLITVSPLGFSDLFKKQRIVLILDVHQEGGKKGVAYQLDRYALGQLYIKIQGQTTKDLLQVFKTHKGAIVEKINQHRMQGLQQNLFVNRNQKWAKELEQNHQLKLLLPKSYVLVKSEENFVYFAKKAVSLCETGHKLQCSYQTGIFIYTFPYTDPNTFSANYLLYKRDSLCKIHLLGPLKKNMPAYMEWEKSFPVYSATSKINGLFAMEMKGWWNMVNATMGGPFVSCALLDQVHNRVIVVDGFVFAPNFSKRNFVKELEAIAKSIRIM